MLAGCRAVEKGGFSPPPPGSLPVIALSSASLGFSAQAAGTAPASQDVQVTNSGGGTLTGLGLGTIVYKTGEPAGWLAAVQLNAVAAPATLTIQPTPGTLPPGTYSAEIPVVSTLTGVASQSVQVVFDVTSGPVVDVSPAAVNINSTPTLINPPAVTVQVNNVGVGALTGLSAGPVQYGPGEPVGWLTTVSLAGTTGPTTLKLQATPGTLGNGSYTAKVPVRSNIPGIPSDEVLVSFTISNGAIIDFSPASATFSASAGGANPAAQTVTVNNAGSGSLTGLQIEAIDYGIGQPGGWLAASLSGTTAPASMTLQAAVTSLTAGTYSALVTVGSTDPSVASRVFSASFTITAPPTLSLNPTGVSFSGVAGGSAPAPQVVSVINSGSGAITGLTTGPVAYGSGASGWLTATLARNFAPTTLNLAPSLSGLAPGSYTATVPVNSAVAGVASKNVSVTLNVGQAGATAVTVISGSGQSGYVGGVLAQPLVGRVFGAGNAPLAGVPVTWKANQGGTVFNAVSISDSIGNVSASWQLGSIQGTQTVDLSVSGLPSVSFSASAGPSPNTGNPNEPPGFTKITERSFNSPNEDGWTARADPYYQIVADPSGPKSPGSIGRAIFPKGFVGGSGPILLARSFTPTRRLYISAWFRMSANWQGHRSGVNKIFHVWMDGRNKAIPTAMGIDSNP
ncbi:MAG TPA: hypothetical protein VNH46_07555, partial [Gemmatimonadales bacterium]|nr:hypothetical protein [Gemmatimonadales bacterium]